MTVHNLNDFKWIKEFNLAMNEMSIQTKEVGYSLAEMCFYLADKARDQAIIEKVERKRRK